MVRVTTTDTVVEPDAVSLVTISALVAHMAMLGPRRLDNLAVGTQLGTWQLLE